MILVGFVVGLGVGALLVTAKQWADRRRTETATLALVREVDPETAGQLPAGLAERGQRVLEVLADGRREAVADRERVQEALDGLTEGIVICDSSGRTVFTNRAGADLLSGRHGEALVAAAVDECLRSARAGTPVVRSVELFGPPIRVITVDARPLGDPDAPTGAAATVIDESRIRRLEAVRSDFVANVSHELKTPIGGLALLAEALGDAGDDGARQDFADRIVHEAHRVSRVVDDLLALSEIEGDLVPRREPVAVVDLLARTDADVRLLVDASGVDVEFAEVAPELVVMGDVVQLTSALSNLVENAVKYAGGASPVVVTVTPDATSVRLAVTDQGIGIPSQDLDRVFERFYRVDQARSRETGGTGLGLSIVRNVVQGHGGRVDLTSREGEGTTVTVSLPRGDESDESSDVRGLDQAEGSDP